MRRFIPLSLIGKFFFAGVASSTTVIPPSFEALVSAAHTIFVGEVVNQQAIWVSTPQGRAIKTLVDFRVEDVWKGSSGAVTRLEFMGGTIGEMTMEVVGMPTFRLGQRSVLFVARPARHQPARRFHARPPAHRARLRRRRSRAHA